MGINKSWRSTFAFSNFRKRTFELSRIYWTQQLAMDCLNETLQLHAPQEITARVIQTSFDPRMHFHSVKETIEWIPTQMERNRLHLLVIYTGFLESYLKEITFIDIVRRGYVENFDDVTKPIKLTRVGEAISGPILRKATIPEMIQFASEYFDVDFGNAGQEWKRIYKLRCVAAHNGGFATPKFLKEYSGFPLALNPKEYDAIGLTWDELRTAMRCGDDIAAMIDYKLPAYQTRIIEADLILRELKALKKLPPKTKIWEYLYKEYSLFPIKQKDKLQLLEKHYKR